MKIVLEIENKKKTFLAPKVKSRMFRTALEMSTRLNDDEITTELMDELVQFVCDVFANQFDLNDLYDGLDSENLIPVIYETIEFVGGALNNINAKKKLTTQI